MRLKACARIDEVSGTAMAAASLSSASSWAVNGPVQYPVGTFATANTRADGFVGRFRCTENSCYTGTKDNKRR